MRNQNIVLRFDHCQNGWKQPIEGSVSGFEIKTKHGDYKPVRVQFENQNDKISIAIDKDVIIENVRYQWAGYPDKKTLLFNKSGLPLGPFSIDIKGQSILQ